MMSMHKDTQVDAVAYLIGGGIASLAAAAFLIRDGNFKGHNIRIFEESPQLGGSLDASGDSEGIRYARRPDDREQVCLHLRPVLDDPDA